MKVLRYGVLLLIGAAVFVRSGQGCAFADDEDEPSRVDPDRPYAAFLAGRLGVVSGELRVRHLVAAYNTMSGRGLTPGEQKAAVAVDRFYNYGGGGGPELESPFYVGEEQKVRAGMQAWFAAVPNTPARSERSVPGSDYESFANCLDDAYVHAAKTLGELRKQYGRPGAAGGDAAAGDTPEIREWIAGQVNVFANCSEDPYGAPGQFGAPGKKGPAAAMPAELPASAPLWLRQARAYQIAAADFYAVRYDRALAEFQAIAGDKGSPYAGLSRYVAARVLIRRATVLGPSQGEPREGQDSRAVTLQRLGEARDALQAILRDPAMAEWHTPAQHLLDYVQIRRDPAAQAEELARRLTAAPKRAAEASEADADYRQNVIDMTVAFNALPSYSVPSDKQAVGTHSPTAPLLRWMIDLNANYTPDMGATVMSSFAPVKPGHLQDALAEWRSSGQPQWLAAVLINAEPGAAGVEDALAAARSIPQTSPAWPTVTYNRIRVERLAGRASHDEVVGLMPAIERTQGPSAINLFGDLKAGLAPSLEEFLKSAAYATPQSIQEEPGEGMEETQGQTVVADGGAAPVTLCGVPIGTPDARHLDRETAVVLNQRLPLRILQQASLSPTLPGNVRFEVAHMTWTRAVLLDRPEVARAVSPYLAQCQPTFKTWLDAYDDAKTADGRQVAALLALMRFSSTEPTVRTWMERDFAAYDYSRDNWWCDANVLQEGMTESTTAGKAMFFTEARVVRSNPPAGQPDPPFLTRADKAEADAEMQALGKVGDAGDYFARQALAWVAAHPDDPHNADVLGFAMRVVRNACRSNATKELHHQLFDVLHRRYPKSEWAVRYTTWE